LWLAGTESLEDHPVPARTQQRRPPVLTHARARSLLQVTQDLSFVGKFRNLVESLTTSFSPRERELRCASPGGLAGSDRRQAMRRCQPRNLAEGTDNFAAA